MVFFCGIDSTWDTRCKSFCVQFEKVGRGLLREGKQREGKWAVWVEARGDEERVTDSTIQK